jgi:hypothetical protein
MQFLCIETTSQNIQDHINVNPTSTIFQESYATSNTICEITQIHNASIRHNTHLIPNVNNYIESITYLFKNISILLNDI